MLFWYYSLCITQYATSSYTVPEAGKTSTYHW